MDYNRKKNIKKVITKIKRSLYGSLYYYESGFNYYRMIPEDDYSVASRYLSRYCGYVLKKHENYPTYVIKGPEPYKKPLPWVPILTRILIVTLGVISVILWLFLLLLIFILTVLQIPLYWVLTGDTVEDESTIISKYFIGTGDLVDWIWFQLKLHRFLDLK